VVRPAKDAVDHIGGDTVDGPAPIGSGLDLDPPELMVLRGGGLGGILVGVESNRRVGHRVALGIDHLPSNGSGPVEADGVGGGDLLAPGCIPMQTGVRKALHLGGQADALHTFGNCHIKRAVAIGDEMTAASFTSEFPAIQRDIWNRAPAVEGDEV